MGEGKRSQAEYNGSLHKLRLRGNLKNQFSDGD